MKIDTPPALLITANMQCVHNDAGRTTTDTLAHVLAIFSKDGVIIEFAFNTSAIRTCSLRRLSSGTRNDAVFESQKMSGYFCSCDEFRSHFLSDTTIPIWSASAAARA